VGGGGWEQRIKLNTDESCKEPRDRDLKLRILENGTEILTTGMNALPNSWKEIFKISKIGTWALNFCVRVKY
jgi:hypothetical protein